MPDSTPYQTKTETHCIGGKDYHIQSLKDRQQYHDPDNVASNAGISSSNWPIFGQVWPAGLVLAEIMSRHDVDGLRILELGCGLGIAAMILTERNASVIATDQHHMSQIFMAHNSRVNDVAATTFALCDWTQLETEFGEFDLIIGSDLLYETIHPKLLAEFIAAHCKPTAEVIMVDGGRKLSGRFDRLMLENGFNNNSPLPSDEFDHVEKFKGKVLHYRCSPNSVGDVMGASA